MKHVLSASLLLMSAQACSQNNCENPTDGTLGALTAWEEEYLSDSRPPPPESEFLTAEDGLPLAYLSFPPANTMPPQGAVLLVPGSTAYAELYSELGRNLAAQGIHAHIIDVRGHGRSTCNNDGECSAPPPGGYDSTSEDTYFMGRPGDSRDSNQIIRDLGQHIEYLNTQLSDPSLVLVGHSSGAGIVSRYVEHTGFINITSVALLAPYHHPDQPQNRDLSSSLCPGTAGSPYAQVDLGALGDAERSQSDRYVLHFVKDDDLTAELDTLKYTNSTRLGMSTLSETSFISSYVKPTLWLSAEKDHLFIQALAQQEFEKLPGGGTFVSIKDTSHLGLIWSPQVAELIAQWVTAPGKVQ